MPAWEDRQQVMEILCTVKAVCQIEQDLAPKSSLLSPSTAVGQALPRHCLSLPFLPRCTRLFLYMGPEGSPLERGASRQQEQPVVPESLRLCSLTGNGMPGYPLVPLARSQTGARKSSTVQAGSQGLHLLSRE